MDATALTPIPTAVRLAKADRSDLLFNKLNPTCDRPAVSFADFVPNRISIERDVGARAAAKVNEDVWSAVVRGNETPTFLALPEFDRTGLHHAGSFDDQSSMASAPLASTPASFAMARP